MSIDEAWDFFSNPQNLSEITPKDMGFNITSEISNQMYVGQIISYEVSPVLGIKLNWVTEITMLIIKCSLLTNKDLDHTRCGTMNIFLRKSDKTEVTDKVSFKAPFGIIGRLMTPFLLYLDSKKYLIIDINY